MRTQADITQAASATVAKDGIKAIKGEIKTSGRTATRVAYDRKRPSVKRSSFPAAPFDAQSLAGTGALVFEGEMIGSGN